MFSIVIHGGAGTILRENMSSEKEKEFVDALKEALNAAYTILESNGSALDAVESAVRSM